MTSAPLDTRIVVPIMLDGLRNVWLGYDTEHIRDEWEREGRVSFADDGTASPRLGEFVTMCDRALQLGASMIEERIRRRVAELEAENTQ